MDIEQLEKIAAIMGELGDKGLLAFILWLSLDLVKAVLCWTGFVVLFAVVLGRVRDAIVNATKAACKGA